MDIDSALYKAMVDDDITKHCHVNTNEDGDRFVGIKADSDNVMVYFPIGYQLPDTDAQNKNRYKTSDSSFIRVYHKTRQAVSN